MTRQVAYKGRQLISGLKLFATVYKTLKKKSSLISILQCITSTSIQHWPAGILLTAIYLRISSQTSTTWGRSNPRGTRDTSNNLRAVGLQTITAFWFDLSHHMLATWPPLTLSLMELMMFEAMAMLLVTTARMIIVAANALSLRFVIPWTSLQKNRVLDSKLT